MNQTEMRKEAISLARAEMRRMGIVPENASANEALRILDNWVRQVPMNKVVARWYHKAREPQFIKFINDWNNWRASVKASPSDVR